MSQKKDEDYIYEDKEVENVKCSPPQIPWSNPNEVRASQTDEKAIAMEKGVPFEEEKEEITPVADTQDWAAIEKIDMKHPDMPSDQHM